MLNEASRDCGGAITNFKDLHIEMWVAVCLGAIPPIRVHSEKLRFKMQTCIRIENLMSLTKNRMRMFYNDLGDVIAKLLWLQDAETKGRKRSHDETQGSRADTQGKSTEIGEAKLFTRK